MSRLKFTELALRHGLRHPDMVEIVEANGLTCAEDIATPEGRERAVKQFKACNPGLFGPEDGGKSMMQAMGHMGSPSGTKESASQRAVREAGEEVYRRQVKAFHAEPPEPEKPVSKMTAAELDEYERRVIQHGERTLANGLALAELRKALRG